MNDFWTWTQTTKPVIENEGLAGCCPKCLNTRITLEYVDGEDEEWLEVRCYVCNYKWKVDPADKKTEPDRS